MYQTAVAQVREPCAARPAEHHSPGVQQQHSAVCCCHIMTMPWTVRDAGSIQRTSLHPRGNPSMSGMGAVAQGDCARVHCSAVILTGVPGLPGAGSPSQRARSSSGSISSTAKTWSPKMRGGGQLASMTPRSALGSSSTSPPLTPPSSLCMASKLRWDLRPDWVHQNLSEYMVQPTMRAGFLDVICFLDNVDAWDKRRRRRSSMQYTARSPVCKAAMLAR